MKAQRTLSIDSEDQCRDYASALARELHAGDTIGLSGSLGAGKTTLVRFLAAALGVRQAVSSPSYVLAHEYQNEGGGLSLEHWDLYRLASLPEELREPIVGRTVRCIEWVEKFPELQAQLDYSLTIEMKVENSSVRRRLAERRK